MPTEHRDLIEHLESYFGKIKCGWNSSQWTDPAIQIVEFAGGTVPNVTVVGTLGMSEFAMTSRSSAKEIRQELFVMVRTGQLCAKLPAVLDQVARERVRTDNPILRGDVVSKDSSLPFAEGFVGFYATLPIYYPHDLWTFHSTDGMDVVFCWLMPIMLREEAYIRQNGWRAFEEIIDDVKIDLFDLKRQTVF